MVLSTYLFCVVIYLFSNIYFHLIDINQYIISHDIYLEGLLSEDIERRPVIYLTPEDLQGRKTTGKTTQGKHLKKDRRADKLEALQEANELRYRRSKQKKIQKEMISKEERKAQLALLPKEDELLFLEGYNEELSPCLRLLKIEDVDVLFGSMMTSEYRADTQQESDRLRDLERRVKSLKGKDKDEIYLVEARDIIYKMFNHVQSHSLPTNLHYDLPEGVVLIEHEDVKFPKFDPNLFISIETGKKKSKIVPPLLEINSSPNWLFDFFSGKNLVKKYLLTLRKIHSIIKEMKLLNHPLDIIIDVLKSKMYLPKNKPFTKKMAWITSYLPAEVYYYDIKDVNKFSKIFSDMIQDLQSRIIEYAREHYRVGCMSETDRKSMYEHRAKLFADIMRQPSYQLMFQLNYSKQYITNLIHKENHNRLDSQMTNSHAYISHVKMKGKNCHKIVSTRRDAKYEDAYDNFEDTGDEPQSFSFVIPVIQACFVGLYTTATLYMVSSMSKAKKSVAPIVQRLDYASNEIICWLDFIKKPSLILSDNRYQPLLIEAKSILHACYHFYKGNKTEGISWLTNLLVTRPESMLKVLNILHSKVFDSFINPPEENEVVYRGNTYILTNRQLRRYTAMTDHERGIFILDKPLRNAQYYRVEFDDASYQLTHHDYQAYLALEFDEARAHFFEGRIRLEGKTISELTVSILSFFQEFGVNYLTDSEIRNANQKLTLIRNNRQANEGHCEAIQNIISVVVTLLGGCDPFNKELMEHQAKMASLNKYMDEVLLDSNKTPERNQMITRLKMYKEATELIQSPQMEKVLFHMKTYFIAKVKSFENKAKEANTFLGRDLQRYEPTTVLFSGPPKTGKTAAMNFLVRSIDYMDYLSAKEKALREGVDFTETLSTSNRVYYYSEKDDYWEGYERQKYTFCDEVLSKRDIESRQGVALDLLQMINVNPMPLNMAFDQKGNSYFGSDYVFITTNLWPEGLPEIGTLDIGMTDPNALRRRMHICVHKTTTLANNIATEQFQIVRCDLMPELRGSFVTTVGLARIIRDHRELQRNKADSYALSEESLAEYFPEGSFRLESGESIFIFADYIKLWMASVKPALIKYATRERTSTEIYMHIMNLSVFILGLCFVIMRFTPLLSYFFPESKIVEQSLEQKTKSGESKKIKMMRTKRVFTPKPSEMAGSRAFKTQSDLIFTNPNDPMKKISESIIHLEAGHWDEDGNYCADTGTCFHIRDGFIACPSHLLSNHGQFEDSHLILKWSNQEITMPWPKIIAESHEEDLMVFLLPNSNKPPPMYRYLYGEDNLYVIPQGEKLQIVSTNKDGSPRLLEGSLLYKDSPVSYPHMDRTLVMTQTLFTRVDTKSGDSGAMVFQTGHDGRKHLVSMHIAARDECRTSTAISLVIYKEIFDTLIKHVAPHYAQPFPHEELRTTTMKMAHVPPNRTSIHKTQLHGIFGPPECVPAHLKPFKDENDEFINPFINALKKLHQEETPCEPIPESVLPAMKRLYPRQQDVRVLTPEEACFRFDRQGFKSVCFGTSKGYMTDLYLHPDYRQRGKSPFIFLDESGDYQFSKEFLDFLDLQHQKLLRGEQIEVIYADLLKDETRPIQKVAAGKTRMFSSSPLHALVLGRMYFEEFILFVQSTPSSKPISVGINMHSQQAAELFMRLHSTAGSVISGDYSNFDGKLPTCLGKLLVKFINWWYDDGPINARVRELLFEHMYSATHIFYNIIYQVRDGNPSGNYMTTVYNSFLNWMMLYIVLTEDYGFSEDEFNLAVYGDDNVITTKQKGITCNDIAWHILRRFDMEYTHFSKALSTVHDDLFSIRYLGRAFVRHEGFLRCPLSKPVIYESIYWYHSDKEELSLTSAISSMFLEMSHYSREEYDSFVQQFTDILSEINPVLLNVVNRNIISYDAYKRKFYSEDCKFEVCDDQQGID